MNQKKRPIGIHVRLHQGLLDIIEQIAAYRLSIVQSFLLTEGNKYIALPDAQVSLFLKRKKELQCIHMIHAAYWSGLTNIKSKMFSSLKKEVAMAADLESEGVVIHAGAFRSSTLSKEDQIAYISDSINELHQHYPKVRLILENTPHAGRNFGGNIEDFAHLIEKIESKNNFGYCFDTAHAYVYGYDVHDPISRKLFLKELEQLWLPEYIQLLHLNDANQVCGSHIDKHEIPGNGYIGSEALASIMNDALFVDVPIIIELSHESDNPDRAIALVASWDHTKT